MTSIKSLNRNTVLVATLASAIALAAVAQAPREPRQPESTLAPSAKVRIGVYDTRAIAIAWARSNYSPVRQKIAELDAARKAGDEQRVKELEAWGMSHQRLAHFQGFSRVPVGDLLQPVRNGMAEIARRKGLAAITMGCDHVAAGVEVVDITDALVALYEPSDRTLGIVRSLRNVKPIGLVEAADLKATD